MEMVTTSPEKDPLFSAVIVTCNDIRRLRVCLDSLSFCNEIVAVDLGSVDGCPELALEYGAKVYNHECVPVVELVRETAFSFATHDWIVHIDPDEVFPVERVPEIAKLATNSKTALIRLPWTFYFRGKPLKGTVWGWNNSRQAVYHRGRIIISKEVHVPTMAKNGFREENLVDSENGSIRHYWMDTFSQLLEKHRRYLRQEGKVKYEAGERFGYLLLVRETLRAFLRSFFICRGWSDSLTGIFLSFFYAWYISMSYLSLRRLEKELNAPITR